MSKIINPIKSLFAPYKVPVARTPAPPPLPPAQPATEERPEQASAKEVLESKAPKVTDEKIQEGAVKTVRRRNRGRGFSSTILGSLRNASPKSQTLGS